MAFHAFSFLVFLAPSIIVCAPAQTLPLPHSKRKPREKVNDCILTPLQKLDILSPLPAGFIWRHTVSQWQLISAMFLLSLLHTYCRPLMNEKWPHFDLRRNFIIGFSAKIYMMQSCCMPIIYVLIDLIAFVSALKHVHSYHWSSCFVLLLLVLN